jgi:transcriptional regulator
MKIYETLFKDSGLTQIDISKELSMTQQNVSKKKQNMPAIKALSIAMKKLNINSIEAQESGLSVKIERL